MFCFSGVSLAFSSRILAAVLHGMTTFSVFISVSLVFESRIAARVLQELPIENTLSFRFCSACTKNSHFY